MKSTANSNSISVLSTCDESKIAEEDSLITKSIIGIRIGNPRIAKSVELFLAFKTRLDKNVRPVARPILARTMVDRNELRSWIGEFRIRLKKKNPIRLKRIIRIE